MTQAPTVPRAALPHRRRRRSATFPAHHRSTRGDSGFEFRGHAPLLDAPDPRRLDLHASLRDPFGDWIVRRLQPAQGDSGGAGGRPVGVDGLRGPAPQARRAGRLRRQPGLVGLAHRRQLRLRRLRRARCATTCCCRRRARAASARRWRTDAARAAARRAARRARCSTAHRHLRAAALAGVPGVGLPPAAAARSRPCSPRWRTTSWCRWCCGIRSSSRSSAAPRPGAGASTRRAAHDGCCGGARRCASAGWRARRQRRDALLRIFRAHRLQAAVHRGRLRRRRGDASLPR